VARLLELCSVFGESEGIRGVGPRFEGWLGFSEMDGEVFRSVEGWSIDKIVESEEIIGVTWIEQVSSVFCWIVSSEFRIAEFGFFDFATVGKFSVSSFSFESTGRTMAF